MYGTMPFSLHTIEQKNVKMIETLQRTVEKDVTTQIKFLELLTIFQVLEIIANSDGLVVGKLANRMGVKERHLKNLLTVLEKTGIIWRIYPLGSTMKQIVKPSKYLFKSSAFRNVYFTLYKNITNFDIYKGKLLEDFLGLAMKHIFELKNPLITYDSEKGGADMIVTLDKRSIVFEIGYGYKSLKQVEKTMKKIRNVTYGIVISQNQLSMNTEKNILILPVKYMLSFSAF